MNLLAKLTPFLNGSPCHWIASFDGPGIPFAWTDATMSERSARHVFQRRAHERPFHMWPKGDNAKRKFYKPLKQG